MQSLFTEEGVLGIKARISQLGPDSPAQWGKMNVSQMLAHCQAPLNVGLGIHPLGKYNFIIRAIGRMVKKSLVKDEKPYKKNQPTDKSFIIADNKDFEAEKAKLWEAVDKFSQAGKQGRLGGNHPFFGSMTLDEWDRLQWKHLDHHLRQFGG